MWGGGTQIRKVDIPTYWEYNEPRVRLDLPTGNCGDCGGVITYIPDAKKWKHNTLGTGCPDLDLRKRLTDEEVIQGIRGNGRPTVQALMQPQLDEWKRPDWIVMETIDEIDWSWIGRFGRGLAYGWIQILAELYLPWIGLACYKIHTLLRRNA